MLRSSQVNLGVALRGIQQQLLPRYRHSTSIAMPSYFLRMRCGKSAIQFYVQYPLWIPHLCVGALLKHWLCILSLRCVLTALPCVPTVSCG